MRMILVLLPLLLPSVSAAADCGFLLWAEDSWTQSGDKGASSWVNWKLIRTDSSLAQCEASSRAKIKSVAESIRGKHRAYRSCKEELLQLSHYTLSLRTRQY